MIGDGLRMFCGSFARRMAEAIIFANRRKPSSIGSIPSLTPGAAKSFLLTDGKDFIKFNSFEGAENFLARGRRYIPFAADELRNVPALEIEPSVCMVRLLVAQLRVLQEHIVEFQSAISHTFSAHPRRNLFRQLAGAGPTMAPRLAAAFGTVLNRFEDAAATQRYFGVAPVTEKSGSRKWVHWRWNAPTFLRQTMVEWAGQTVVYCPWAKAYYQHQKAKGVSHWAILRALAFKWLRIIWPCWQHSQPYDEEKYLRQLELRRSPIAVLARRYALTMNT